MAVTVVRDRGHTLDSDGGELCWTFPFRFPTHYPTTTEFLLDSIARGGLPIDQRTKYIDNQTRPNLRAPLVSSILLLSSCQPLSTTSLSLFIQSNAVYCKPDMILASLLTVVLASFIGTTSAQAQIVYDSIHNATTLVGTWSSGAQNVMTGPVSFLLIRPLLFDSFVSQSFANPANMSFNYPLTTGVSYSLCVFSLPLWYHQADVLWLF